MSSLESQINLKQDVLDYAKAEYGTEAAQLWRTAPNNIVLQHKLHPGEKKSKWYGAFLSVKCSSLGIDGEGYIDLLNVKLDPEKVDFLRMQKGYLPAYHMNKEHWVSILLDGTISIDNIKDALDESFQITASKKEKRSMKRLTPKDWIVPANPKYFDIVKAFEKMDIIDWKQSSDVRVGDLIYMYVAAPYSALMYKCKAVEVDIPWNYESKELSVRKVMRIQLLCKYEPQFMTFERMKSEFEVFAVRGPRNMPSHLKEELTAYEGENINA